MPKAIIVKVKGRVQGVGFRPFVYQIAKKNKIKGTVQNNMDGVYIVAEGEEDQLNQLLMQLRNNAPRLSRIDSIEVEETTVNYYDEFSIIPSKRSGASSLVIPVDASVCEDCLKEMNDPTNFRYQYPFINCTQCGPRYTIIDELPYDRPYTVMREFDMCEKCQAEYEDPTNRRHHAQPIACPTCGPKVTLFSMEGDALASDQKAIEWAKEELKLGKIVAVKGIGGYHLACDATNPLTVELLRNRKKRPQKPLAIMVKNVDLARTICDVDETEEKVLSSTAAPIVVLKKKRGNSLPEGLAPGMNTLGVMLPYTPLHHLLFQDNQLNVLVMTSANPSGLPMLYQDDEAFDYLRGIADVVLAANRKIKHPIDDSVVQVVDQQLYFIRRARGYVPDPIFTKQDHHGVIALGSQQKNTFAIGRHQEIFVGPHIGDMNYSNILEHYSNELHHLLKWMGPFQRPIIAMDMHQQYAAREMVDQLHPEKVIEVQHHHAHQVSCMLDNDLEDTCYGIILDGTGYGEDGHIWGFEVLYGDASHYKRIAHLRYSPLPAGEKAIKEPWRTAVGMLIHYFGAEGREKAEELFPEKKYEIGIIHHMMENQLNCPLAGTCGRLFDAVSAILGVCSVSSYDGEAAIKLSEQMLEVKSEEFAGYPYRLVEDSELLEIDFAPTIDKIVQDRFNGRKRTDIIADFHETIVQACVDSIITSRKKHPTNNPKVVLSGGSFHNPYLMLQIRKRLESEGYTVYTHKQIPCNDGGLSIGQLVVAAAKQKGVK